MNQRSEGAESRAKTFRHHTSKVTYGGIDGAYYTSSRTRRAGSDGVCLSLSFFYILSIYGNSVLIGFLFLGGG